MSRRAAAYTFTGTGAEGTEAKLPHNPKNVDGSTKLHRLPTGAQDVNTTDPLTDVDISGVRVSFTWGLRGSARDDTLGARPDADFATFAVTDRHFYRPSSDDKWLQEVPPADVPRGQLVVGPERVVPLA